MRGAGQAVTGSWCEPSRTRTCLGLRPNARKNASAVPFPSQAFLTCVMVAFFVPLPHAQDIDVKVLNARNGKPITNECLNVWIGPLHGVALYAPTNNEGVAVLHIRNNEATAKDVSPSTCNARAALGPRSIPKGADTIAIAGGNYVACQEYGKPGSGEPPTPDLVGQLMPSYSIKKILESGVSAANTCGKFRAKARPGELIFYVRPLSFLERMRQ
jgi:hypothetical protein